MVTIMYMVIRKEDQRIKKYHNKKIIAKQLK